MTNVEQVRKDTRKSDVSVRWEEKTGSKKQEETTMKDENREQRITQVTIMLKVL